MVHFDEQFLTIHWDEDTKVIWAEWKGNPAGEVYRRGMQAGLELIQQRKARKWLADTKLFGTLPTEDMKWAYEDWLPRALAAGLRWMAFVTPKKVIAKTIMKNVTSRVDEHALSIAHFETLDEARDWLLAQN